MPEPRSSSVSALPPSVAWLGYGGLLPFVGLAAAVAADPGHAALWRQALVAYGAVILSFVGALHWAFGMLLPGLTPAQVRHRYGWSVVPALLAWPAVLLPLGAAVPLLVAGFVAHYLQDRALAARAPLPVWYLPLRLRLTGVASLALVAALMLSSS